VNKVNPPDTFLRLRDTPDSYGATGQLVQVNLSGKGLGFSVPTTVAALPTGTAVALGSIGIVTDASAGTAWGTTVTGGGSLKVLVWWDGTNWTVLGK
jgi:hypothetical protein